MTDQQIYEQNKPLIDSIMYEAEQKVYRHTQLCVNAFARLVQETCRESEAAMLVNSCLAVWDVELSYLQGKNRKNPRPIMRKIICMLLGVKVPSMSLELIGDIFHQDHTTIIHARRSGNDLLATHDYLFLKYYNPVKHLFDEA